VGSLATVDKIRWYDRYNVVRSRTSHRVNVDDTRYHNSLRGVVLVFGGDGGGCVICVTRHREEEEDV
jgi:hypothetical protein